MSFNKTWLYTVVNNSVKGLIVETQEDFDLLIKQGYKDSPARFTEEEPKQKEEPFDDLQWQNDYPWLLEFEESIKGLNNKDVKAKKDELEALCLKEIKLDLDKKYSLARMIKKVKTGEY